MRWFWRKELIAQLPRSLSDYSSAIIFPEEGVVALTLQANSTRDDYYFRGIERLEFADATVTVAEHVEQSILIDNQNIELIPFRNLEFGQYEYIDETFNSGLSTFYSPGPGNASIIGSADQYDVAAIPGVFDSTLFNGNRATINTQPKDDYAEPSSYTLRNVESIVGLYSGYWYSETENGWFELDVYDLHSGTYKFGGGNYGLSLQDINLESTGDTNTGNNGANSLVETTSGPNNTALGNNNTINSGSINISNTTNINTANTTNMNTNASNTIIINNNAINSSDSETPEIPSTPVTSETPEIPSTPVTS